MIGTLIKILLFVGGTIGELFLLVKGYFASKSRGWRGDWECEAEQRPHYGTVRDIFLLHGFASSRYTLEKVIRYLTRQGYHVWAE